MFSKLQAIDLFAGAGGLSYGFEQTGKVETRLAVEINRHAQRTFKRNHPQSQVIGDIKRLNYSDLNARYPNIDLVIGGPPCQGFSNANRQKNALISGNNQLIREFVKSVERLNPRAFVMENVKGLASGNHKFFVSRADKAELHRLGIATSIESFSIGKSLRLGNDLVSFIKGHQYGRQYLMADSMYSKLYLLSKYIGSNKGRAFLTKNADFFSKATTKWGRYHSQYWCPSYFGSWERIRLGLERWYSGLDSDDFDPEFVADLREVIESQRVFRKIRELDDYAVDLVDISINDTDVSIKVMTYKVLDYVVRKLAACGYEVRQSVLNAADFGVPQIRERLFVIGIRRDSLRNNDTVRFPSPIMKSSDEYFTVGDAIQDLAETNPSFDLDCSPIPNNYTGECANALAMYLNDTKTLHNHVVTQSTDIARNRFSKLSPGQNFHDLDDKYKSSYTNANRTQNTIYFRLTYEKASKSVCNVRKSMWIHPMLDRAVSIREAARLQSFPDSYVFEGTKDSQYQQIANAVPPLLARAVAEQILDQLGYSVETPLELVLGKNKELSRVLTLF